LFAVTVIIVFDSIINSNPSPITPPKVAV